MGEEMVGLQIVGIQSSLASARELLEKAGILAYPSMGYSSSMRDLEDISKQLMAPPGIPSPIKGQGVQPQRAAPLVGVPSPVTGRVETEPVGIPSPMTGTVANQPANIPAPGGKAAPGAEMRAKQMLGMAPSTLEGPAPWDVFAEQMKQQGVAPTALTAGSNVEFEERKESGAPQMVSPGGRRVEDPGFSDELRAYQKVSQKDDSAQPQVAQGDAKISTPEAFEETSFARTPSGVVSGAAAAPNVLPPAVSGERGIAPPPPSQVSGEVITPSSGYGGGYMTGGALPVSDPTSGLEKKPAVVQQQQEALRSEYAGGFSPVAGKAPVTPSLEVAPGSESSYPVVTGTPLPNDGSQAAVPVGGAAGVSAYDKTGVSNVVDYSRTQADQPGLAPMMKQGTTLPETPGATMSTTPAAIAPGSTQAEFPSLFGQAGSATGANVPGASTTQTTPGMISPSSGMSGKMPGSEQTNPSMMGSTATSGSSSTGGSSYGSFGSPSFGSASTPGMGSSSTGSSTPDVGTKPMMPAVGSSSGGSSPGGSSGSVSAAKGLMDMNDMNKGVLIGPGHGFGMGRPQEDNLSEYVGSPYEAKALELHAKQCRVKADLNAMPCMWDFKKKDPNEKKRKALHDKLRDLRSDWMRLHADMLEGSAKELRENDDTQKSMNKAWVGDNISDRLRIFYDTPYQAQALECLGKEQDLEAKMSKLPRVEFEGGIMIDPEKKRRQKLREKIQDCQTDFFKLQAKVLKEQAGAHRKHNGNVQKSGPPVPPHNPQPVGEKKEVTLMQPYKECRSRSGDRRFAGDMGTELDVHFFHKAESFEKLTQKIFS